MVVFRHMQGIVIVLVVVLVLVLEIESAKTASRTTTSTSTSTIRITNKIHVPQPSFDPKKFLFSIKLAVILAGGWTDTRNQILGIKMV